MYTYYTFKHTVAVQCENLRRKTYIIIRTYLYTYYIDTYIRIHIVSRTRKPSKKKILRSYYVPISVFVFRYYMYLLTSFTKTRFFLPLHIHTYSHMKHGSYEPWIHFINRIPCYFYTSCLFCRFCRHEVYYFKITTLNTADPDRVIHVFCTYTGIPL
jgi:hypothetical protein